MTSKAELEILLKAKDEASQAVKSFNQNVADMSENLRMAGLAMTAVGAAGLAMTNTSKEINAQLASTAITLNMTKEELRDMVLETTNVTFGIESVTATFELLTEAGIRNEAQLKASANAFDALADATGTNAETVADILIPALKALGEEIPTSAEEMDRFTWLTKNTTTELSEFGAVMDYVAMYGGNLNVSLDEMIAIMAVLESQGKGGATATRLFRTAVNQAKDGTVTLNDALGVTQDQINGYLNELEDATGLTQEHADAMNSQYTIMDTLKQGWDEMTLSVGSFLEPLEPVFALMTALGPAMIFLSTEMGRQTIALIAHKVATIASTVAVKAATVAQWLWNAALTANPIGLVIGLVVALSAAIAVLVAGLGRHKEEQEAVNKVEEAAIAYNKARKESEGEVTEAVVDAARAYVQAKDALSELLGEDQEALSAHREMIRNYDMLNDTMGSTALEAYYVAASEKLLRDQIEETTDSVKDQIEALHNWASAMAETMYGERDTGLTDLMHKYFGEAWSWDVWAPGREDAMREYWAKNFPGVEFPGAGDIFTNSDSVVLYDSKGGGIYQNPEGIPQFETGGIMPYTGLAYLHRNETIIPAGGMPIQNNIRVYIGDREVAAIVEQDIANNAHLQGGA